MPTDNKNTDAKPTPTRRPPTDAELAEAKKLIERAIKKGGADALRDIHPLAFRARIGEGFDATDPDTLLERSVEVEPIVNPLFEAVMLALGFDKLGARSFTIGAGADLPKKILLSVLAAVPDYAARPRAAAERVHSNGIDSRSTHNNAHEVMHEIERCPAGSRLNRQEAVEALSTSGISYWNAYSSGKDCDRHREHGLVSFSSNGSSLTVTVASAWSSHRGGDGRGIFFWDDAPDLHLLRVKGRRDPVRVTPLDAIAMLETARAWGFPVVDGGGMSGFRKAALQTGIVERIPGSPGEARVLLHKSLSSSLGKNSAGMKELGSSDILCHKTTARKAGVIVKKSKGSLLCDPQVDDIIRMEDARPTGKRKPLRPYQDEAVSLHLATDYGYVNACAPGLGKTVMTLQAQRERAAKKKGYRSLVVCPAAIRSQWIGEAGRFFPEAETGSWTGRAVEENIDDFLADAGDAPAIVFLSYDAMRSAADKLSEICWDDLICDEAAILGSTGTGRTNALWQLRRNCDVAVALTGTPINKSIDDLGYIVSWVRGDETAFYGQKLSRRFDMALDDDVEALWRALGPTVFRRDRSEIADQLPHIDTEVIKIDPEPAELALAKGAREELKKIYENLQAKLEIAESLRPDDPALRQAREDMKKIRGAVLGGVTLARMAACDPGSLSGAKSKSAGVALLDAAGLIEPAQKKGGTKRNLVCGLVEDLVQRDDAVLIFTDFSSVADNLCAELSDRGIRVGAFTGKTSGKRRDQAAEDFQKGDLDCLVLTGAGREGLNLQRASVLIHYDLPWVPSQVVQRVGRASRFGSTSDHLSVLIPIMQGTIEERVAALLVPRAVEALRALDSHRGVDGAKTEVGLAVAGLDDAVDEDMKKGNSLFDLAGEVLGSS